MHQRRKIVAPRCTAAQGTFLRFFLVLSLAISGPRFSVGEIRSSREGQNYTATQATSSSTTPLGGRSVLSLHSNPSQNQLQVASDAIKPRKHREESTSTISEGTDSDTNPVSLTDQDESASSILVDVPQEQVEDTSKMLANYLLGM